MPRPTRNPLHWLQARPTAATGRIRLDGLAEMARRRGYVNGPGRWRGLVNVWALARDAGLAYSTVAPLIRHPERAHAIELTTLAALCEVLDCQPGELLTYSSGASSILTRQWGRYTGPAD